MTDLELERLYKKYFPCIYSICFLYMKSEADACDICQEVFIRLYKSIEDFKEDENVKAWLIKVASNLCKNELKKWWRTHTTGLLPEQFHQKASDDQDNLLLEMVDALRPDYRIPIYLHYFEGYKSHEIGKLLGISSSAVRSRLEKGRRLLKNEILEESEENSYEKSIEKNADGNPTI